MIARMPQLRKCEIDFRPIASSALHLSRLIDIDGFIEMFFGQPRRHAAGEDEAGDALLAALSRS